MELKFKPGDFVIYVRPTDGRRILAKILDKNFNFFYIELMEVVWGYSCYWVSSETLHLLAQKENDLSKALDSVGLL